MDKSKELEQLKKEYKEVPVPKDGVAGVQAAMERAMKKKRLKKSGKNFFENNGFQNGNRYFLLFMPVWRHQNRFIIGIRHKTCLAFARFFDKFALTIVHRDFTSVTPVRIIRANFRGV